MEVIGDRAAALAGGLAGTAGFSATVVNSWNPTLEGCQVVDTGELPRPHLPWSRGSFQPCWLPFSVPSFESATMPQLLNEGLVIGTAGSRTGMSSGGGVLSDLMVLLLVLLFGY